MGTLCRLLELPLNADPQDVAARLIALLMVAVGSCTSFYGAVKGVWCTAGAARRKLAARRADRDAKLHAQLRAVVDAAIADAKAEDVTRVHELWDELKGAHK